MFLAEFFRGIRYYGKAHQVIFRHRLWKYMMLPGILSLLYVLMVVVIGWHYFPAISAHIADNWMPGFMKSGLGRMIASALLWIFMLLIAYLTYKPAILILFSPILGYLSEITEERVFGRSFPESGWKEFVRLGLRGLFLNLRNLAWTIFLSMIAWLFIIIPIVGGIVSAILIALIQFYYDGFGLMDYTLERKGLSASQSIGFAKQHRGKVMGIGSGFMLMMLVPVLGWFAAPSYGTVAATLAAAEALEK